MTNTIKSVTAVIDGVTLNLTLNPSTGKYEATGVAPQASSYPLPGGYYPVSVTAAYETDESTTVDDTTAGAIGDGCKFVVKEKVKPVARINYPTAGQYITSTADQRIDITVLDNVGQASGFSGIDLSSLDVHIGTDPIPYDVFTSEAVDGGYHLVCVPTGEQILEDGDYTMTVSITDHDGNVSDTVSVSFTCDTVPPELSVSAPVDGFATSAATVTVVGATNDATSAPVIVSLTLNGRDMGTATINQDGTFEKELTFFEEGDQTLVVTATDKSGTSTVITRRFYFSTDIPVIEDVVIEPNPADHGTTYTIRVTVH